MTTGPRGVFESSATPGGYREHLEGVMFEPWAERLLDVVGVAESDTVLDVATGTGAVARAAARRAGPTGRVLASDISPAMLAQVRPARTPAAPIETLECDATDLRVADASVDVVLCQQGLPFVRDRAAAAREMHRVLRQEGRAGAAVWLAGAALEPFQTYADAVRSLGLPQEPFRHAYVLDALQMSREDCAALFLGADFAEVDAEVQTLELAWPDPRAAAEAIMGTPYGSVLARLDPPRRDDLLDALELRMTAPDGAAVRHVQTAVLLRASL